jgi:hypothetical protein
MGSSTEIYEGKSVTFFRSGKRFGDGGVDWAMQTARLNKTCRRTRQQPYCRTAPGTKHSCDLWLATQVGSSHLVRGRQSPIFNFFLLFTIFLEAYKEAWRTMR